MKIFFFSSLFFLFYHLFLYGIILQIASYFKVRKEKKDNINLSTVTVVAAAHNEEKNIKSLLDSFIKLNYPVDLIKLIIVSDDSIDKTNQIVEDYADKYYNIKLQIQQPRNGKASAMNLIEPQLDSDIIVSTDASSFIQEDSIHRLVEHFADDKIGLVSGRMIYKQNDGNNSGEGLYWKYESWLRKNESKLYSIIVASGCLFAIRRKLYNQIHPSSPDDFERTLITLKNGRKAIIEPSAIVYENLASKSSDEMVRRIRIISTEWFAVLRNITLLNPFKFPIISFFLFSHKIIRWLLPILSLGILLPCLFSISEPIFKALLIVQVIGYVSAGIELLLEKQGKSFRLFKLPGYWLAMNIASFLALIKFIMGKQQKTWDTT